MIHFKVVCGTDKRDLVEASKQLQRRYWGLFFNSLEFFDDGHDSHAMHFLALAETRVIAGARLCAHHLLQETSDFHLYRMLDTSKFPGPYGCFNRLAVDVQFRGRGVAATLDCMRTDTAERWGCSTILGVWNAHSGEKRRQSLENQSFVNVSNGQALPDGGFGESFPYAKRIDSGVLCGANNKRRRPRPPRAPLVVT
jgi:GNAT superfamily N-acetyltransferase